MSKVLICIASVGIAACAHVPGSSLKGDAYSSMEPKVRAAGYDAENQTSDYETVFRMSAPSADNEGPADLDTWIVIRGVRVAEGMLESSGAGYLRPLTTCMRNVTDMDLVPGFVVGAATKNRQIQIPMTVVKWTFAVPAKGNGTALRVHDVQFGLMGTPLKMSRGDRISATLDISVVSAIGEQGPSFRYERVMRHLVPAAPTSCDALSQTPLPLLNAGASAWGLRPELHTVKVQVKQEIESAQE